MQKKWVKKHNHKILASIGAITAVVVVCLLMSACSKNKPSAEKKPMLAFVINCPGRFWEIAHAGCNQAAAEENVMVEFHVPGQGSAAQQKQILEALVARGCKGVAISPLNPQSIGRILDKVSEYMPVICQDSDAPNCKRICYIGTNNIEAGKVAGEQLKQALAEGGKVAVFAANLDIANQRERYEGVAIALKDSTCEIVEVFTDQTDRTVAQANVRTALAKYPDLKGIVGTAGYNAPAAIMALKDCPGHNVKVVGFDEDIETLEAIRNGHMVCSVAQQPYEFGYSSIKMLAKLHRGEAVAIPKDQKIYVPVKVITAANVDEVEQDINKKLSKLKETIKLF
jgi:ribose transport system substrate-binding protein